MNSRDEKAAFDAMMDEIENDDSDNDQYGMKNKNVRGSISYQSQPKRNSNFNKPHSQMKHINDLEYKNQGATNRRGGDDFDNSHQLQSEIDNFGSTAGNAIQNEAEIKKAELVELKRFLTRPCRPNEPPLKLYVERDRGGFNMLSPVYRLYLEAPNNNANEVADSKRTPADTCVNGRFLMYATKQLNSKTSSYLFSCEPNSASNTIDDRGKSLCDQNNEKEFVVLLYVYMYIYRC